MTAEPQPRDELLDPYLHPYRRYLPTVWRKPAVRRVAIVGAAAGSAGVAASLATDFAGWAVLGLLVLMFALAGIARITAEAVATVWRLGREWDQRSELGTVRASRPHAGEIDEAVAHDEFAVTAEDTGHFLIWRFTPLSVVTAPAPGAVLVPGRPRWSADVVEEHPLVPDAARAAEQLVEVQERAALLEAEARATARERAIAAERRRDLERETSSTAAALRHLTGQQPPRRRGRRR